MQGAPLHGHLVSRRGSLSAPSVRWFGRSGSGSRLGSRVINEAVMLRRQPSHPTGDLQLRFIRVYQGAPTPREEALVPRGSQRIPLS